MQRFFRTPLVAMATLLRILPFLALYALAGCAEDYTEGNGTGIIIDSIRPSAGYPGTIFRVYGRGFSSIADSNRVFINGTVAVVGDPASLSTLLVSVPSTATSGPVTIEAAGLRGAGPVFTVFDLPRIDQADTYTEGKTLTIIGDHFATDKGLLEVYFNGEKMTIFNVGKTNDGKLYVETPYPGSREDNPTEIILVSEGVKSLPYMYTATPRLTDLTYQNRYEGRMYVSTTVALYGLYFGLDAPGNEIRVTAGADPLDVKVKILTWAPDKIEVELVTPPGNYYTLAVLVNGVTSNTQIFRP